jgi:hypothetical protein
LPTDDYLIFYPQFTTPWRAAAGSKQQETEDRSQKTEGRGQKTEDGTANKLFANLRSTRDVACVEILIGPA